MHTRTSLLKLTVKSILNGIGYSIIDEHFLSDHHEFHIPRCFSENRRLGNDLFGKIKVVDFVLYDPPKFPSPLVIDCLSQNELDPVDEYFPFYVKCIAKYAVPTVLVIENDGYCSGAEGWLRAQAGKDYLESVFNENEFRNFVRESSL